MYPRWEQHRLPVVECQADEALLHDEDHPVAMLELVVNGERRRGGVLHKARSNVVHARLREKVLLLLVHQKAYGTGWHKELRMGTSIQTATHNWATVVSILAPL